MLPKDARKRRDAAAADKQTRLDSHLKELPLKERVIPYTDELFRNTAIEWLVSTDQVSGLYRDRSIAHYKLDLSQFRRLSTQHFK